MRSEGQRGFVDARREFCDPTHGCVGQQRWYAGSNSEKAKPDADAIATEMIKYAASCRSQGKPECCTDCVLLYCGEVAILFHLGLHLNVLHVNSFPIRSCNELLPR